MAQRVLIYLLRRDLRVADNPIFHEISKLASQSHTPFTHILPIYVFAAQQIEVGGFISDPSKKSPYPEARSEVGRFWRCGPHRARFLAQSVWDLKEDLKAKGSDLVLRAGMLGEVLDDVLTSFRTKGQDVQVVGVWMTGEEGVEEKQEERAARSIAEKQDIDFKLWIDEKYFIDDRDIPFDSARKYPDVFTSYRKAVEPLRDAPRKTLATPKSLPALPDSVPPQKEPFSIPDNYDDLEKALLKPLDEKPMLNDITPFPKGTKSAMPFQGGSKSGHKRVQHLIATGSMTKYKDTRNGLLGLDFSTKLSAWLALGCITARQVHFQLLDFEEGRNDQYKGTEGYGKGENKGTAAVRFELLWRDYMRLCTRKFGPRLFKIEGFRNDASYPWKTPDKENSEVQEAFHRFLNGTTGTGLIDASQRELYHTGYTSNRARQNVASYLAKHLGINWKLGAEWYECQLSDYDLSNNWGNWQYVAGVGNDPRGEARVFNPVKQAFDYDPRGDYVKAWVEELRGLSEPQEIFQVHKTSTEKVKELGLEGNVMVEKPLKRIEFRVGGKGGRGGGKHGGSSRGYPRGKGKGGNHDHVNTSKQERKGPRDKDAQVNASRSIPVR
ncbi:hypothetical protein OHC33_005212 [Knufia fluminis]|uniref:Cryptochrome DASH n=1 Tax=Knufia fluminis TaxID=191047 RepID=A0AAN8EUF7_9EURO|nr:hypothetical protein OHC33_005212 [Knufia fluminis]